MLNAYCNYCKGWDKLNQSLGDNLLVLMRACKIHGVRIFIFKILEVRNLIFNHMVARLLFPFHCMKYVDWGQKIYLLPRTYRPEYLFLKTASLPRNQMLSLTTNSIVNLLWDCLMFIVFSIETDAVKKIIHVYSLPQKSFFFFILLKFKVKEIKITCL